MKQTKTTIFHYFRFSFRLILFLIITCAYCIDKIAAIVKLPSIAKIIHKIVYESQCYVLVFLVFVFEIFSRFFPSKIESPGAQKHFALRYQPTGNRNIEITPTKRVVLVGIGWIAANLILGFLKFRNIIATDLLLVISSFYALSDMICVLFFCPFQLWFLKHKCCATCRMYNWDFAMIFTPLLFIFNVYAYVLVSLSLILLLVWEISAYRHPERFADSTNAYISCKNCTEKLCHQKKHIRKGLSKISLITKILEDAEENIAKQDVEEEEEEVLLQENV